MPFWICTVLPVARRVQISTILLMMCRGSSRMRTAGIRGLRCGDSSLNGIRTAGLSAAMIC
ncbi:hypothetical protein D3C80_2114420 [compost metagenome]